MSRRRKIDKLARQRGADGLLELARGSTSEDETSPWSLNIWQRSRTQMGWMSPRGSRRPRSRAHRCLPRTSTFGPGRLPSCPQRTKSSSATRPCGRSPIPSLSFAPTAAVVLANNDVVGRSEVLIGLLDDPEGPVRQMAAAALVEIGDVGALPRLRDRVQREGDEHARAAMRRAIVSLEERPGS